MAVTSSGSISLQLNDYRGLSAYEIAVKNGFEGSEKEWLSSLKGEPGAAGDQITVNRKRAVDGNVTVNATDIYMTPGAQLETVAQAIDKRIMTSDIVNTLDSDETDKPLSAAQGKALLGSAVRVYNQQVTLTVDGWALNETTELYEQAVEVTGITGDIEKTSVVVSPMPDRETREAYIDADVLLSEQRDGAVLFTASSVPAVEMTVQLMVVAAGVSA